MVDATGYCWSRHEVFLLLTHCGLRLQAAVPEGAMTISYPAGKIDAAVSSATTMHRPLALLQPFQVRQLWATGMTQTEQPWLGDTANSDSTMEWFAEPVAVTFDNVRVSLATLRHLLSLWRAEITSPHALPRLPEWLWTAARSSIPPVVAARSRGVTTGRTVGQTVAVALLTAAPPAGLLAASRRYRGRNQPIHVLAPRVG